MKSKLVSACLRILSGSALCLLPLASHAEAPPQKAPKAPPATDTEDASEEGAKKEKKKAPSETENRKQAKQDSSPQDRADRETRQRKAVPKQEGKSKDPGAGDPDKIESSESKRPKPPSSDEEPPTQNKEQGGAPSPPREEERAESPEKRGDKPPVGTKKGQGSSESSRSRESAKQLEKPPRTPPPVADTEVSPKPPQGDPDPGTGKEPPKRDEPVARQGKKPGDRRPALAEPTDSRAAAKDSAQGDTGEAASDRPADSPDVTAPPENEPAEKAVRKATEVVRARVNRRKLDIKSPDEAKELIEEIIGRQSELSRAEELRKQPELRGRDRPVQRSERERSLDNSERRAAVDYLLRQLQGQAVPAEAPAFLRRNDRLPPQRDGERAGRFARDDRDARYRERYPVRPRLRDGRRLVRFRSQNEIPAILLAASALNRLDVQRGLQFRDEYPARGDIPRGESFPDIPSQYRDPDSYVVSYKVDEKSMVSRDDILFRQGSTQFADPYSYDIVLALADAIGHPSMENDRFIVEGHASAEGSYESNLELSQRRAERIVRDMVREGIDPNRLIPVGHGEAEARYPADAPEDFRSRDRRVTVFRLQE